MYPLRRWGVLVRSFGVSLGNCLWAESLECKCGALNNRSAYLATFSDIFRIHMRTGSSVKGAIAKSVLIFYAGPKPDGRI